MEAATSHAGGDDAELLYDAEGEVRYPGGLDHPRAFQSDGFGPQMLEQSDTPSEQDGHQIDVYLVKKSGPYSTFHSS